MCSNGVSSVKLCVTPLLHPPVFTKSHLIPSPSIFNVSSMITTKNNTNSSVSSVHKPCYLLKINASDIHGQVKGMIHFIPLLSLQGVCILPQQMPENIVSCRIYTNCGKILLNTLFFFYRNLIHLTWFGSF